MNNTNSTFKKLILDDLKKQGLGSITQKIKSIRYESYTGGSSVRVKSLNLFKSEREKLEALLSEYERGRFDGMTDSYEYKSEMTKPRAASYVFLNNDFSECLHAWAKDKLKRERDVIDDATAMDRCGMWLDQAVWRQLQQLEDFPVWD